MLGGLALSGCFVDTARVASTGRITVRWSIAGAFDPNACRQMNAAAFHVGLNLLDGGFAGEYAQTCNAFATTIDLLPGRYSATARLEDPAGRPRTTTITLAPFTVLSDTNLTLDVDFPRESFF